MTIHPLRRAASQEAELLLQDPRDAQVLNIGLLHLRSGGLNRTWLLREAAHRHVWSIAEFAGASPGTIRDTAGRRVLTAVVAARTIGRTASFREDDLAELRQVLRPNPLNGWRSETQLIAGSGARISVEIVTAFATRNGPSNRTLEAARMAPEMRAETTTDASRRADALRRHGSADRRLAEIVSEQPNLSVRISGNEHMNGVGLVDEGVFDELFSTSEANALPSVAGTMPLYERRIHLFGNLDMRDVVDLVSRAELRAPGPNRTVAVTSHARRRADGLVVAVCESIYRA